MLTLTEVALKKMVESKQKMRLPVKGLRIQANPISPLRASFSFRFEPAEEPPCPTDVIVPFDGIDLYIAAGSAPYLQGATVDHVFSLVRSEFKVDAPLRKLDTPEGHIATRIQEVLDDEVNPSLAAHGGAAVLMDFKDGIAYLELSGGCQGCSMAGATMKDGIETSIRARVPGVQAVRDITRHAQGIHPYFQ